MIDAAPYQVIDRRTGRHVGDLYLIWPEGRTPSITVFEAPNPLREPWERRYADLEIDARDLIICIDEDWHLDCLRSSNSFVPKSEGVGN